MTTLSETGVTDLLVHWGKGDKEAVNKLIPLVYDELHKLARRYRAESGLIIRFRQRRWSTRHI